MDPARNRGRHNKHGLSAAVALSPIDLVNSLKVKDEGILKVKEEESLAPGVEGYSTDSEHRKALFY